MKAKTDGTQREALAFWVPETYRMGVLPMNSDKVRETREDVSRYFGKCLAQEERCYVFVSMFRFSLVSEFLVAICFMQRVVLLW